MTLKKTHVLVVPALVSLITACSSSSINIPDLSIACTGATDCVDISGDGHLALVALFTTDCATVNSPANVTPAITGGATASCGGGGTCTAAISTWYVGESTTVTTTMAPGNYALASFIDTNDNEEPDSGEPFYCDDVTIENDTAIALTTGWADFP